MNARPRSEITGDMMIKRAGTEDAETLAGLAIQMWTDNDSDDLAQAFRELARDTEAACFIQYATGTPIAFAQCQLRYDYVEGTDSSPVGYLEGVFVAEGYRRNGVASKLLTECEEWARGKGCAEFASDCELDNEDSRRFHLSVGFEEANRIICFRKAL